MTEDGLVQGPIFHQKCLTPSTQNLDKWLQYMVKIHRRSLAVKYIFFIKDAMFGMVMILFSIFLWHSRNKWKFNCPCCCWCQNCWEFAWRLFFVWIWINKVQKAQKAHNYKKKKIFISCQLFRHTQTHNNNDTFFLQDSIDGLVIVKLPRLFHCLTVLRKKRFL